MYDQGLSSIEVEMRDESFCVRRSLLDSRARQGVTQGYARFKSRECQWSSVASCHQSTERGDCSTGVDCSICVASRHYGTEEGVDWIRRCARVIIHWIQGLVTWMQ